MRQTVRVEGHIYTLSFSDDGTSLQTNQGPLHVALLSNQTLASRQSIPRLVFVKDQWVGRGTENILWLPSEHRSTEFAIHNNTVAFGYNTGRVSVIELA